MATGISNGPLHPAKAEASFRTQTPHDSVQQTPPISWNWAQEIKATHHTSKEKCAGKRRKDDKRRSENQFRSLPKDAFQGFFFFNHETQGKVPYKVLTFAVPVWVP